MSARLKTHPPKTVTVWACECSLGFQPKDLGEKGQQCRRGIPAAFKEARSLFYVDRRDQRTTRVPLIIRTPGMAYPGYQSETPVSLLDLYPTILALCTAEEETEDLPEFLDGQSLVNILGNPSLLREKDSEDPENPENPEDPEDPAVRSKAVLTSWRVRNTEVPPNDALIPIHAVRGDVDGTPYHYIQYGPAGSPAELYNLSTDPWEMDDLLADGMSGAEGAGGGAGRALGLHRLWLRIPIQHLRVSPRRGPGPLHGGADVGEDISG